MCAYRGKCPRFCAFYKVTCKCCGDFYVGNTQNALKSMEQYFQDVAQKFTNDKNSDSFTAHFTKHFTQKPSPQQCRNIISFRILYREILLALRKPGVNHHVHYVWQRE